MRENRRLDNKDDSSNEYHKRLEEQSYEPEKLGSEIDTDDTEQPG